MNKGWDDDDHVISPRLRQGMKVEIYIDYDWITT